MADKIEIKAIPVVQPIGEFFSAVIDSKDLVRISSADMRRIDSGTDQFVGIQRKLQPDRVKDISKFVCSVDATFPTSVVLSVPGSCADYDDSKGILTLHPGEDPVTGERLALSEIANILDGQHRVEGLKSADGIVFQVPVSIFIDADPADEAFVFATVNLAQTKVNRSLVYDLLDYAKARSPQKSAHDIAVALDKFEGSPLTKRIKRLGTATPGRTNETLAQATVVAAVVPLLSDDPEGDRYALAKGKRVGVNSSDYQKTPLRQLWVDEKEVSIVRVFIEFFKAVEEKWPDAWGSRERGAILSRTNGFRALMRLFKNIYVRERPVFVEHKAVVTRAEFKKYFDLIDMEDSEFTSSNFKPGSSGETDLYKRMRGFLNV